MLRFVLAAVAALACLATPSTAAPANRGKITFRNYSSVEVLVDQPGTAEPAIVLLPFRGRAVYRHTDLLGEYPFAFDSDGDLVADREFTVSPNGNRNVKVSVGDFGIHGLQTGP